MSGKTNVKSGARLHRVEDLVGPLDENLSNAEIQEVLHCYGIGTPLGEVKCQFGQIAALIRKLIAIRIEDYVCAEEFISVREVTIARLKGEINRSND